MKSLLHISDTHGGLTPLCAEGDVVVHSGDFLPNRTRGIRPVEETFQRAWVEENAVKIREWIGGRKFLFVPGNHDYADIGAALRYIGVDATELVDEPLTIDGFTFVGFKWVPFFTGDWNYEIGPAEMSERLAPIAARLDTGPIDVMVAHAPIYGVLDRNWRGDRCGNKAMRTMLQAARHVPGFYLCGHIHEGHGYQAWERDTVIVNSAVGETLVKLKGW